MLRGFVTAPILIAFLVLSIAVFGLGWFFQKPMPVSPSPTPNTQDNLPKTKHIVTSLGFMLDIPDEWKVEDNQFNVILSNADGSEIELKINSGTLTNQVEREEDESFEDWVKRFSRADTVFADKTPMSFKSEFNVINKNEVLEKRTAYNSEFGPGPHVNYYLYIEENDPNIKNYIITVSEKDKDLLEIVKGFIKAPL